MRNKKVWEEIAKPLRQMDRQSGVEESRVQKIEKQIEGLGKQREETLGERGVEIMNEEGREESDDKGM